MALHYFCRRKGPKKGPGAWPGVRSGAALPFKAKMRVITPGVKLPVAVMTRILALNGRAATSNTQ